VRVEMPGDLQMLLLNVAFLTLLMQRLIDQRTTKILVATTFPLFCVVSNISNKRENLSEPQCFLPNQKHFPWSWAVSAVMRYTGQC